MRKRIFVVAFLLALAASFSVARALQTPGPVHTYTISFEHDGVATDRYAVLVDGVAVNVGITCAGTPRICSGSLPMTQNVPHLVIVKAIGTFGEMASDPFSAAPPTAPRALVVKQPS